MKSASTQFVPARRMGIYEQIHQMGMWGDFNDKTCLDESSPQLIFDNQSDTSLGTVGPSVKHDQEANKPAKVLRRLAQNREAARKSRLRKKAYVQQLENSKSRLIQLERELQLARQQQALYAGGDLNTTNPALTTFQMEYEQWVEELNRQISRIGEAFLSNVGDVELRLLVDCGVKHFFDLYAMKSMAAKADVFYVMSGLWKTPAEQFFLWIGGFRPSEVLRVMRPHLDPLSEQQQMDVGNLTQSCQQTEDALSQGVERLHLILAETIVGRMLGDESCYGPHIRAAVDNLEALVRFVAQADHLRQETLEELMRILTTRQAARALVAFGEYLKRVRALSKIWSSRA